MRRLSLILTLFMAMPAGILSAQDDAKIDWNAEYLQLLESDPGVRRKIESGQTSKEEVIQWLQETRGRKANPAGKGAPTQGGKQRDLSAFRDKLAALVAAGKLSKADAAKLAATISQEETERRRAKKDTVDWDAAYEKLLKSNPDVRRKVEGGDATKEQVIEYMKMKAGATSAKGEKGRKRTKAGARKGSVNFYAIVIGRLRSKDIELGELELDVDYVLSEGDWAKRELVGRRVKLVGVAGPFLDNLLRIKRGETIKIRTGDYNRETKTLGFGYKFQVLERTSPFSPEEFGVPPEAFRGFRGELVGKVVEALGYEVLLEVERSHPAADSKAKVAKSIVGKRVRIAGFYRQHSEAFADLHEGDNIRVSVAHRNPKSDTIDVTDVLSKVNR